MEDACDFLKSDVNVDELIEQDSDCAEIEPLADNVISEDVTELFAGTVRYLVENVTFKEKNHDTNFLFRKK